MQNRKKPFVIIVAIVIVASFVSLNSFYGFLK